jgi:hypothetical protein
MANCHSLCSSLSLSLFLSFFLSTFLPPVVACLASSGGCPTMYPSTYLLWTSTMYHLLLSYLYATWFYSLEFLILMSFLLWNSVLFYRMFGKHGRWRKTKVCFSFVLSFLKHPTQKLLYLNIVAGQPIKRWQKTPLTTKVPDFSVYSIFTNYWNFSIVNKKYP